MCGYNGIEESCTCPKADCPRHGKCRDCVAFHREKKNKLPFCLRNIEWTDQ